MKSWVLAVGLLAAAFVPAASAADVDDEKGAYKEPRYKNSPPPSFKDQDDDEDDGPPPAAKKYSGPPPSGQNCVRSDAVRERLTGMGWRDFHGGQPQGELVTLRARRPSGRLFELTLERCSGQIVEVRPMEPRPSGPYAFNRPPREDLDDGPPPRPYAYYGDRWRDGPYAYGRPRWWYRSY